MVPRKHRVVFIVLFVIFALVLLLPLITHKHVKPAPIVSSDPAIDTFAIEDDRFNVDIIDVQHKDGNLYVTFSFTNKTADILLFTFDAFDYNLISVPDIPSFQAQVSPRASIEHVWVVSESDLEAAIASKANKTISHLHLADLRCSLTVETIDGKRLMKKKPVAIHFQNDYSQSFSSEGRTDFTLYDIWIQDGMLYLNGYCDPPTDCLVMFSVGTLLLDELEFFLGPVFPLEYQIVPTDYTRVYYVLGFRIPDYLSQLTDIEQLHSISFTGALVGNFSEHIGTWRFGHRKIVEINETFKYRLELPGNDPRGPYFDLDAFTEQVPIFTEGGFSITYLGHTMVSSDKITLLYSFENKSNRWIRVRTDFFKQSFFYPLDCVDNVGPDVLMIRSFDHGLSASSESLGLFSAMEELGLAEEPAGNNVLRAEFKISGLDAGTIERICYFLIDGADVRLLSMEEASAILDQTAR